MKSRGDYLFHHLWTVGRLSPISRAQRLSFVELGLLVSDNHLYHNGVLIPKREVHLEAEGLTFVSIVKVMIVNEALEMFLSWLWLTHYKYLFRRFFVAFLHQYIDGYNLLSTHNNSNYSVNDRISNALAHVLFTLEKVVVKDWYSCYKHD